MDEDIPELKGRIKEVQRQINALESRKDRLHEKLQAAFDAQKEQRDDRV